jgi:Asp-tRNA(Asn)/Glu-tRNA(Gln) amidotransferase A subunit family amidase
MGLTSRAGVIPLSYLADIAGPMARTVEDAVAVFQAIAGEDPDDPVTMLSRGRVIPNYRASLLREGLRGARIGILRQAYDRAAPDPEIAAIFAKAVDDLKAAGAEIVDPAPVELPQRAAGAAPCRGFKYDMDEYLKTRGGKAPVHSVDEIVASGNFHESVRGRLPAPGSAAGGAPESEACQAEMTYRSAFGVAVTRTMDELKLDAFVYPTWSFPPQVIGQVNGAQAGDNSQVFSPTSGFPAINVPMGFSTFGVLPAGMTIYGRAWSEATLIKLAYAYEQATHHRRPPLVR